MLQLSHRYPYNPKLKIRAQYLRNHMTEPEKKMWFKFLGKLPLNPPQLRGKTNGESRGRKCRVYRQRPIGNFIVDFYIPLSKLVIEIDGENHFTEQARVYDEERTQFLEGLGIRVIRFTNKEVMDNFDGICSEILRFL